MSTRVADFSVHSSVGAFFILEEKKMKNILKRALATFLVVTIVLCSAPLSGLVGLELPDWADFSIESSAATSGTCGANLTWTFDDSTGTLTISGTGEMDSFDFDNRPWEDYINSIVSIVIGDSVTSIGEHAFYYCDSLTSITIGDGVTEIRDFAFCLCRNLTDITIGNKVTSIGRYAFESCDNITSVKIGDSVTSIGDSAFDYCENLIDVYYVGKEDEWNKIIIGNKNENLLNATFHYNFTSAHTEIFSFYQEEHPHYAVYECSCGYELIRKETTVVDSCELCSSYSEYKLSIKTPSQTTIRYKDSIIIHTNFYTENFGDILAGDFGVELVWTTDNDNFKVERNDRDSVKITSNKNGSTIITVTLIDDNGEVLATDSVEMYSKAGLFDKIGGFFRSLFGATKIYDK